MAISKNSAKHYKVLVNTGKPENNQLIEITQGGGDRGQPVRIKAQAGVKYQLQETDKNRNTAPDYVKVKRVGKDLHIIFEDDQSADLIIEDYYSVMPEGYNGVIGQAENGNFYEYYPEDPDPKGLIPQLADGGEAVNSALGGQEVQGSGAALAVLAFNPLLGALGLAGAAAAAGSGGSTVTPVVTTGALALTSDSGVAGDNITKVSNPDITGRATPGAAVKVTINGVEYTSTADANGNYTVKVTNNLTDGPYTPAITVTPAGGTATTTSGTPFTIDTVTTVKISSSGTAATLNPITGTAEAGDVVTLKDANGQVIGSAVADSSGNWSVTPSSPVTSGGLSATAVDKAGNTATAQGTNVVPVNNNSAGVTIAAVSADSGTSASDFYTNDKTLTYSGTVSNFSSNGDVVKLELKNAAGAVVASTTVTPLSLIHI